MESTDPAGYGSATPSTPPEDASEEAAGDINPASALPKGHENTSDGQCPPCSDAPLNSHEEGGGATTSNEVNREETGGEGAEVWTESLNVATEHSAPHQEPETSAVPVRRRTNALSLSEARGRAPTKTSLWEFSPEASILEGRCKVRCSKGRAGWQKTRHMFCALSLKGCVQLFKKRDGALQESFQVYRDSVVSRNDTLVEVTSLAVTPDDVCQVTWQLSPDDPSNVLNWADEMSRLAAQGNLPSLYEQIEEHEIRLAITVDSSTRQAVRAVDWTIQTAREKMETRGLSGTIRARLKILKQSFGMVTEVERREWGEYEHGVDRRSAEAQGLPRVDVGSEIKDAVDKGIRRAFGKVRLLAYYMRRDNLSGKVVTSFETTENGRGLEVEFSINLDDRVLPPAVYHRFLKAEADDCFDVVDSRSAVVSPPMGRPGESGLNLPCAASES